MNAKGKAHLVVSGAAEHRRRMVTSLKLIGYWPRRGNPGPGMGRILLQREIGKGLRLLDDDALVAVMWVVNALGLPAHLAREV